MACCTELRLGRQTCNQQNPIFAAKLQSKLMDTLKSARIREIICDLRAFVKASYFFFHPFFFIRKCVHSLMGARSSLQTLIGISVDHETILSSLFYFCCPSTQRWIFNWWIYKKSVEGFRLRSIKIGEPKDNPNWGNQAQVSASRQAGRWGSARVLSKVDQFDCFIHFFVHHLYYKFQLNRMIRVPLYEGLLKTQFLNNFSSFCPKIWSVLVLYEP